ncbi:MAG TPA: MmcQ/YjbR family DNA-binding protein [Bacteroidales bacterium]|nr:MmcQ/YjbR family DNA-binding protein [Bacteroidales bacterium]HSA44372.1 MmcQ/YjbR family DNA-binding protein [Bacteroidales bacterium]
MDIESFRTYCLLKEGVTESFPFDADTLVMKVSGRIFALTSLSDSFSINLKCDPERAIELRERHPCIIPGYHMNKIHWNTVIIDGSLNDVFLEELIDHSYALVAAGSRKKKPLRDT